MARKLDPDFVAFRVQRPDFVAAKLALSHAERALAEATLTASEAHASRDAAAIAAAEKRYASAREQRWKTLSAFEIAQVAADDAWTELRNAAAVERAQ